jgi:Bacterial Ig domain/Fibronectin type III domain/Carboxypeptidase regulatory-like domain
VKVRKFLKIKVVLPSALFVVGGLLSLSARPAHAACPSLPTTYGIVTLSINVPATTTYAVWSRMKATSSSNDSYYLQIDDSVCGLTVGDDSSVTTSGFSWTNNKKEGQTTSKITAQLTAGSHQLKLIGREPGVQIDKVIFLSDLNCNPNQTNCEAIANDAPPSAPSNLQAMAGNQSVLLSWSGNSESDLSNYNVSQKKSTDTNWSPSFTVAKTSTSYSFTGLSNGEAYDFRVAAVDNGGNASNFSTKSATPVAPADTQPPTVNLIKPSNNITVSGSVQLEATAQDNVEVKKVEFYVDNIWVGTDITSPYTYLWLSTSASEDQNHAITAKAYDYTNPASTSAPVTVKVDNVDNIPPTVQITSPDDGSVHQSNTVIVTATAADNTSVASMRLLIDGLERLVVDGPSLSYPWSINDSDNGSHLIRVEAFDASGNPGGDAVGINVQLSDQSPPAVPKGLSATAGEGQIQLNWSANSEPDFSHYSVRYKKATDPDVGSNWTWPATSLTSTSYTFTGLINDVEYDVQVRSIDGSNNKSDYAGLKETPKSQDTTPPNPPANLVILSGGSGQLNLSWQASSSSDLSGYNIYRNGIKVADKVNSTTFGESGLVNNTLYAYQVSAVDSSNNESALSNSTLGSPSSISTTGSIAGTVKDTSGKSLNAYIYTYVGKSKKSTTSSSSTGLYLIGSLPTGSYNLYIQKSGYVKQSIKTAVIAAQLTTQNISLAAR